MEIIEIGEKFLPIGTVVILKNAKRRVMITGYCVSDKKEPEKIWDYCGCPFPEGVQTLDFTFMFDHSQVEKIYYMGLKKDEEGEKYLKKVKKIYDTNIDKYIAMVKKIKNKEEK